jgi:hypothetical protein
MKRTINEHCRTRLTCVCVCVCVCGYSRAVDFAIAKAKADNSVANLLKVMKVANVADLEKDKDDQGMCGLSPPPSFQLPAPGSRFLFTYPAAALFCLSVCRLFAFVRQFPERTAVRDRRTDRSNLAILDGMFTYWT